MSKRFVGVFGWLKTKKFAVFCAVLVLFAFVCDLLPKQTGQGGFGSVGSFNLFEIFGAKNSGVKSGAAVSGGVFENGEYSVVLDAGHGGYDGGCQSPSGVKEADINFKIVKFLETELLARGVSVVLTRTSYDTLASPFATNKKRDDMQKRLEVIKKTNPTLFVSVHLNSLPSYPSVRGLQCFYGNDKSKSYAEFIQKKVNDSGLYVNRVSLTRDFYFFDNAPCPSVLVEAGFLSNRAEEKLLVTREYQQILAYHIAVAICESFVQNTK